MGSWKFSIWVRPQELSVFISLVEKSGTQRNCKAMLSLAVFSAGTGKGCPLGQGCQEGNLLQALGRACLGKGCQGCRDNTFVAKADLLKRLRVQLPKSCIQTSTGAEDFREGACPLSDTL